MCSRWPLIGSYCQSTIMALVFSPPLSARSKMVLWPLSERRIAQHVPRIYAHCQGVLASAIHDGGNLAFTPHPACLILGCLLPADSLPKSFLFHMWLP